MWAETLRPEARRLRAAISTHSARVGGDRVEQKADARRHAISTHSARVGGDYFRVNIEEVETISTHSARVGGDILIRGAHANSGLFQPTPPVWAETRIVMTSWPEGTLFQPTPPVWAETSG